MAQNARPTSDVSNSGWTTAPLYSNINESVASDAEFISTGTAGAVCVVALGAVTDPVSSTGHVVFYRAKVTGSGPGEKIVVALYEGATQIAATAATTVTRGSFNDYSLTLTGTQADSITDYSALRLQFTANTLGSGETLDVSYATLEVPDAGVDVTFTLDSAGATTATNIPGSEASANVTIPAASATSAANAVTVAVTGGSVDVSVTLAGVAAISGVNALAESGTALAAVSGAQASSTAHAVTVAVTGGAPYVFSAYVQMADNSAPVPGTDFGVTLDAVLADSYVVTWVGGTIYRVSAVWNSGASSGTVQVVRTPAHSGKSFTVSGDQMQPGSGATEYQKTPYRHAMLSASGSVTASNAVDAVVALVGAAVTSSAFSPSVKGTARVTLTGVRSNAAAGTLKELASAVIQLTGQSLGSVAGSPTPSTATLARLIGSRLTAVANDVAPLTTSTVAPSSIRERIISALVVDLNASGAPAVATRSVNSVLTAPYILVWQLREIIGSGGPDEADVRRLQLRVECVVQGSTPGETALDPLLNWAEQKIRADETRGKLAISTQPISIQWDMELGERQTVGAALDLEMIYYTAFGDPTVSA